jgi:hypothetical protein
MSDEPFKIIDITEFEKAPPPTAPPLGREVTWAELIELEPRLIELENEARSARELARMALDVDPGAVVCGNLLWYGNASIPMEETFKGRVKQLVGWGREDAHPVLGTSEAYDCAVDRFYELLPNCHNCGCF